MNWVNWIFSAICTGVEFTNIFSRSYTERISVNEWAKLRVIFLFFTVKL